jgi:hypothetical protein
MAGNKSTSQSAPPPHPREEMKKSKRILDESSVIFIIYKGTYRVATRVGASGVINIALEAFVGNQSWDLSVGDVYLESSHVFF